MDEITLNVLHQDYIYVYDSSEDPVTGLVAGDFTIRVTVNGTVAAKTVTVTEVNATTRPGLYRIAFTPDVRGYWYVHLLNATYNKPGWGGYYHAAEQQNLGVGNRLVTITVQEVYTGVLIPGALVEVFNVARTARSELGITDANGQVVFSLYDGSYSIVTSRLGSYTFSNPTALTVSGVTPLTIEGTPFSPATPASPALCTIYGWTLDEQGQPTSVQVRAELAGGSRFLTSYPQIVPMAVTESSAAADGYWELQLTRSAQFRETGAQYSFSVDGVHVGNYTVPNQATVGLHELTVG